MLQLNEILLHFFVLFCHRLVGSSLSWNFVTLFTGVGINLQKEEYKTECSIWRACGIAGMSLYVVCVTISSNFYQLRCISRYLGSMFIMEKYNCSIKCKYHTYLVYFKFLGIGVGLSRDASSLMVGQYFKRKREQVEIVVVSGSGLGIIIMSISIHSAIG